MITCCKCGTDCGPGNGVSMCLGCNELKDMEVQDRSYHRDEVAKILAGMSKIDVEAILALYLGDLKLEDLGLSEKNK